jgi:multidrug/hemolysin transport system ATP-binding protein
MKKAIVIENLTKTYGDLKAVDNISFYVEEGSLFAFLGPNGAGKSTTISILNTFLKPDGGRRFKNKSRNRCGISGKFA